MDSQRLLSSQKAGVKCSYLSFLLYKNIFILIFFANNIIFYVKIILRMNVIKCQDYEYDKIHLSKHINELHYLLFKIF